MWFRTLGRQVAAGLLSLLMPGAGQAFNREWRKAAPFLGAITSAYFLFGGLKLLHSFPGWVLWIVTTVPFSIAVFIDAIWAARKPRTEPPLPSVRSVYGLAFFLLAAWHSYAFLFSDFYIDRVMGIRAFKMPSPSMAPTLQEGDRLVADMQAFSARAPLRGELVIYDGPESKYIKRVIAVGGDVIQGDGENVILNGQTLSEPYLLEDSSIEPALADDFNVFEAITVPPDSFFVMGDNRRNSYDSRHRPHGLVTRNQVRGKPLYVYWATDKNRIGTKLE